MAAPRILSQFLPSLSRSSLIKVAVTLWNDFGKARLNIAFEYIELGIPVARLEGSKFPEMIIFVRAMKRLLLIPALWRKRVLEAVHGLEYAVRRWKEEHFELRDEECIFYWRSDGSIDRIKTARQLVLNANIEIRERFDLACMYCLEESIHTLWAEMEESGKTDYFHPCSMAPFWVGRIRNGSQVPWTQAAVEYLDSPRMRFVVPILSCSSFFPFLEPEDRRKFLLFLRSSPLDDLRFCLYTMTKEEEEQTLRMCAVRVLCLYSEWPLRSLFLETTEKVWNSIDETSFSELLLHIFYQKPQLRYLKDFEYCKLVESLWNMSSNHFSERARECSYIRQNIDSCLNEIRKKRKAEDEMIEQIKKMG